MTAITIPSISNPSGVQVFAANVRAEWTKLRSVRSTAWTLLAAVGLAIGFGAIVSVSQMSSWDTLSRAEQMRFDPTFFSLSGLWLAQLAVGVLGALLMTSEYATGQIRATFGATPQRLTVLGAKAVAFAGIVATVGLVASFAAFSIGQAIFEPNGLGVSITDPGVLRAVAGGGLYLAAVGLLGLALGTIVRRTAGAVAALVGVLLLAPIIGGFLPASFQESVVKFFPAQAGMAIFQVTPDPRALSPWTGFAVLAAYIAVAFIVGCVALVRRDA
jgi:hypothetical protein